LISQDSLEHLLIDLRGSDDGFVEESVFIKALDSLGYALMTPFNQWIHLIFT